MNEAELSKKLAELIRTESRTISKYHDAGEEREHVAFQLSQWGESTNDDSVSEISDKIGVVLSWIADQEDQFTSNLEDSRAHLKNIRNIEASVHPSRTNKAKITDEIQKLKHKDPSSTKLVNLEQELVRAEAENLVAEAQLTNVTRQELKEAYDLHFKATIERAEKQLLIAKCGRRLLSYLDDAPVVPGDERQPFAHENDVRQVMSDTEQKIQSWQPSMEPIHPSSGIQGNSLTLKDESENVRSRMDAESEQFEDATTRHHPEDESPRAVGSAAGAKTVNERVTY